MGISTLSPISSNISSSSCATPIQGELSRTIYTLRTTKHLQSRRCLSTQTNFRCLITNNNSIENSPSHFPYPLKHKHTHTQISKKNISPHLIHTRMVFRVVSLFIKYLWKRSFHCNFHTFNLTLILLI